MSVISSRDFIRIFSQDWLGKKMRVVQVGLNDGEISRIDLIPRTIEITDRLQNELKKAFVAQGLFIAGQFLHIAGRNIESDGQKETHLLIELDDSVVYEGRQNHLAVITDKESVSFVRSEQ